MRYSKAVITALALVFLSGCQTLRSAEMRPWIALGAAVAVGAVVLSAKGSGDREPFSRPPLRPLPVIAVPMSFP